jgi:osmotically-inducible protein OsmY
MRPQLFLALSACVLSSGCVTAAVGAVAGVGAMAVQDRPVGRGIDDAVASNQIKARLLSADARAYSRIDVEVADGQVLLSGAAPTMEHRIEAERVAWTAEGIENVSNEIEVGPGVGIMRSAMDELISAQVRARLISAPDIKGINFNIETFKGVVYLMGVATSGEELQRTAEAASTVRGVERVVSYVQVRERHHARIAPQTRGPAPAQEGAPFSDVQPAMAENTDIPTQ